jgi:hypothetical protein
MSSDMSLYTSVDLPCRQMVVWKVLGGVTLEGGI